MKTKEFFKPTIIKIVITVIIAVIPAYKQTICPVAPPCFSKWLLLFSVLNLFFYNSIFGSQGLIGKSQIYMNLIPDFLSYLMNYLLSIFVIYLISCLIVYIYKSSTAKLK